MIEIQLIDDIKHALATYREVISKTKDTQAIEDYSNLAAITDDLLNAINANDLANTKVMVYAFYRSVSDYWSRQPPEFRPLADAVGKVDKIVMKM